MPIEDNVTDAELAGLAQLPQFEGVRVVVSGT